MMQPPAIGAMRGAYSTNAGAGLVRSVVESDGPRDVRQHLPHQELHALPPFIHELGTSS